MKPLYSLIGATILSSTLLCQPALAAGETQATTMAAEMSKEYHEQLRTGQLLVGHVSLALRALDYNQPDIAKKDISEGLKLAKSLEKGALEIVSKDSMNFGKLRHEHEGKSKSFYIPIVDDSFMLHGLERTGKKSEKVRETDAVMVHTHVTLDVRKAVSGLEDAQVALAAKDIPKAETVLRGILDSMVGDEVAVNDPLHVVHDNLTLAQNLLQEKQYDSARYALTYAKKGLGDYNFLVHDPDHKKHVEAMQKDMDALYERLGKEDPGALQKAGAEIKEWASKVKKWLTSHPEPGHQPQHPKVFQHKPKEAGKAN